MAIGSRDVVIIGGGISGTAAAYELARSGASVTLVEKGTLASMASGWTLAGVRQSGRHPAEIPLAIAAVRRWEGLANELDADLEYRQHGNLRLALTPDEVVAAERMVREQRALGLEIEFLPDTAAVRSVAPAVSESVLAAAFCPSDGHANPTQTVHAFAEAARRLGVEIRTETTVTGLDVAGGRVCGVLTDAGPIAADAVVVAAGIYSDRLCALAGLDLPLRIAHVAAVQTVPLPPLIAQVIGTFSATFAGRQQLDGRMRFTDYGMPWPLPAGPLDLDSLQPKLGRLAELFERAAVLLPDLAGVGLARVWGGLLDMTPDAIPVIERAPEIDGLVIAAGFSGHGFCLGPITGKLICDLVTVGEPSLPLDAFRRSRFAECVEQVDAELHG